LIIGFFYILPLVNGADIIQVQNPDQSTQQGSGFWSFIHTAWFKGAIVIIILAIILIVLIVLIGRWLVKYIKTRNDIFYQVRQNRLKLAREQRTYPSKSWFRITRNTPIRLCYKDANGKIKLTRPIAYHRGDYTTHEGNLVISFYMQGHKTFLIIPKIELLVIPNRKEVIVKTKDYKTGKEKEITYSNLPTAKDIVQFNEGEIILYCKSISNLGMFYIPVLEGTKDGKVIDLSMPVYQSLKDVVVEEFLFSQTDEFSKVAKKSIDLNPNLRYDMKRSDPSQSSEIPSSQGK
jgi:hypothetical protein